VFINANIAIGGTSVLILVSVALQTLRAVESRALMITYDQYSQPDFFHDTDADLLTAGTADRNTFRRLLPGRRKK
jgi:hypothetical protein